VRNKPHIEAEVELILVEPARLRRIDFIEDGPGFDLLVIRESV